jgi:hypothetical protein
MLASDDVDVRAYIVATLGGLRYVVLEPARGEDAFRHVDVVMPDMNGRKINRQQRALLRELRSATRPCHPADRTRERGQSSRQLKQQLVRASELDGPLRDQVAPNPVVMPDDADRVEVGAIT